MSKIPAPLSLLQETKPVKFHPPGLAIATLPSQILLLPSKSRIFLSLHDACLTDCRMGLNFVRLVRASKWR